MGVQGCRGPIILSKFKNVSLCLPQLGPILTTIFGGLDDWECISSILLKIAFFHVHFCDQIQTAFSSLSVWVCCWFSKFFCAWCVFLTRTCVIFKPGIQLYCLLTYVFLCFFSLLFFLLNKCCVPELPLSLILVLARKHWKPIGNW